MKRLLALVLSILMLALATFCVVLATGLAWAQQTTQSPQSKPASPVISKMTNADVIQMVGAALSDQVIITSIRQAPAKDFNLTPTGLIALKKAGVSDAIIIVMQEVSASAKSTSTGGGQDARRRQRTNC